MKTNANLLDILPNLAVKLVKKEIGVRLWEKKAYCRISSVGKMVEWGRNPENGEGRF